MGAERPRDAQTLILALQRASARLDWDDIVWERKQPPGGGSGNFGWYVTDAHPENRERWYVRAAHGIAVRRAIPRDQLEEWERRTRRSAREVKRDYREASGRGSHAWFIETYRGEVWRTTKGGYGKRGVTVTRLDVPEGDGTGGRPGPVGEDREPGGRGGTGLGAPLGGRPLVAAK